VYVCTHIPSCTVCVTLIILFVFEVQDLEGVVSVHDPHFWTLCSNMHYGSVVVETVEGADSQKILGAARTIFTQVRHYHGNRIIHQFSCILLRLASSRLP